MKSIRLLLLSFLVFSIQCSSAQNHPLQDSLSKNAAELLAHLTPNQRTKANLSFNDADRLNWDNEPMNMHSRKGLRLDEMTDLQKKELHHLLQLVLSEQGYLKVINVLRLDEWQHDHQKMPAAQYAGSGLYWFTIFGHPGTDKRWGWRFEGHHLSMNITVAPKGISVTPFFIGSHPGIIPEGPYAGVENQFTETRKGWQLLLSLSATQKKKAIISNEEPKIADILTRTGEEPHMKNIGGIAVSELNKDQQKMLYDLTDAYLNNLTSTLAEKYQHALQNKTLHFAWMGGTEPGKPIYYRIQSSGGFIIEYCNRLHDIQHIHTLWRILSKDFGTDL